MGLGPRAHMAYLVIDLGQYQANLREVALVGGLAQVGLHGGLNLKLAFDYSLMQTFKRIDPNVYIEGSLRGKERLLALIHRLDGLIDVFGNRERRIDGCRSLAHPGNRGSGMLGNTDGRMGHGLGHGNAPPYLGDGGSPACTRLHEPPSLMAS